MQLRIKCQIAELISDAIVQRGLKGWTQPSIWMASIFGPFLERRVPMLQMTRHEARTAGGVLALLLPIVLVSFLLALPLELLRRSKVKRHNAAMAAKLPALTDMTAAGYRDAPVGAGEAEAGLAIWRQAETVVAVDFRIVRKGRATFLGSALVAMARGDKQLLWLSVLRSSPPPDATDSSRLLATLSSVSNAEIEQAFWEWDEGDAYELTERPARPW